MIEAQKVERQLRVLATFGSYDSQIRLGMQSLGSSTSATGDVSQLRGIRQNC